MVAHIAYRCAEPDTPADTADVFPGVEEAAAWLQQYDPGADVGGFPPTGGQMDTRKRMVAGALRKRYYERVSSILQAAGITEVIR